MWRPDFPYEECHHARIRGVHRSFCIYSIHHRGTREHPGLVLGLASGGSCEGLVFKVAGEHCEQTLRDLRAREQVTRVYREALRPVELLGEKRGKKVRALCYLAERTHAQFAANLSLEKRAQLIRHSVGSSGKNLDYLINTILHLRELDVIDRELERLLVLTGHAHLM